MYVREAHAIDSRVPITGAQAPLVEDPLHLGERKEVAARCQAALDLGALQTLVDDVDDRAARAFGGWPDRLVMIGTDGRVLFQSAPGPAGFDLGELEAALETSLQPSQPVEAESALPIKG